MKSYLRIAAIGFILSLALSVNIHAAEVPLNTHAQVYFSPNDGCTEAIVKEIDKAKSEILVQVYSFASKDIAKALVDAKKRGVHAEIILDKSNRSAKYT